MANEFVQGGIFGGLNYAPLDWDAKWGTQPALTIGGSQPVIQSQGPVTLQTGADLVSQADSYIKGVTNPASNYPAATSSGVPTNQVAPESSGGIGETISNYFTRGVVIVLGFIFVAVGLVMFKPVAGVVQSVVPAK